MKVSIRLSIQHLLDLGPNFLSSHQYLCVAKVPAAVAAPGFYWHVMTASVMSMRPPASPALPARPWKPLCGPVKSSSRFLTQGNVSWLPHSCKPRCCQCDIVFHSVPPQRRWGNTPSLTLPATLSPGLWSWDRSVKCKLKQREMQIKTSQVYLLERQKIKRMITYSVGKAVKKWTLSYTVSKRTKPFRKLIWKCPSKWKEHKFFDPEILLETVLWKYSCTHSKIYV